MPSSNEIEKIRLPNALVKTNGKRRILNHHSKSKCDKKLKWNINVQGKSDSKSTVTADEIEFLKCVNLNPKSNKQTINF